MTRVTNLKVPKICIIRGSVNLKRQCNFEHPLRPVHTKDEYYNNHKDDHLKRIAVQRQRNNIIGIT